MKNALRTLSAFFVLATLLFGCSTKKEVLTFNGDLGTTEFLLDASDDAIELCSQADTIVTAELYEINEFATSTYEYVFSASKVYSGDIQPGDLLYVYDTIDPSVIEEDILYYLVLNSHQDVAYPHTIYAWVDKSFLPREIDGDLEFLNGNAYGLNSSTALDSFFTALTASVDYTTRWSEETDTDYESAVAAAEASAKVLLVQIEKKEVKNPYIADFKVKVISQWKGSTDRDEFWIVHTSLWNVGDKLIYMSSGSRDNDITYGSKYGIILADSEDGRTIADLFGETE